jgi:hypothetical protein
LGHAVRRADVNDLPYNALMPSKRAKKAARKKPRPGAAPRKRSGPKPFTVKMQGPWTERLREMFPPNPVPRAKSQEEKP